MTKTFKVEIEIEASYDLNKYKYGADIDGNRGEIREEVLVRRIDTPIVEILGLIEKEVIRQVLDDL